MDGTEEVSVEQLLELIETLEEKYRELEKKYNELKDRCYEGID